MLTVTLHEQPSQHHSEHLYEHVDDIATAQRSGARAAPLRRSACGRKDVRTNVFVKGIAYKTHEQNNYIYIYIYTLLYINI